MDIRLSVPFAEDLTRESGWNLLDRYLYFAARFHLYIEQNQTNELAFGDVLRTFHTTPFSETEITKAFEQEFTVVDLRETARSIALSDDLNRKIAATLTGAAKSPFYEISADVGASLEQAIRTSVGETVRSSNTISRREKKTITINQKISSGAQELQLAVAGYRKYSQNVFLHYIDYLFVEYRSTTFGLRRKKRNLPRPDGLTHINRIPVNIPLFKLFYWNLETESSLLFTETEYQKLPKVPHPDRVTFEDLHDEIDLPLPFRPERPTLYTLSNIAFPLHWVDRKGPWTREELEQTELEDANGSAWWYKHGPGKNEG